MNLNGYEPHPCTSAFPLKSDEELEELKRDIQQHALLDPIMLTSDGRFIVDGRSRYKACQDLGVEPRFERLPAGADVLQSVWSLNLAGRHFSTVKKIEMVLKAKGLPKNGRILSEITGVHRDTIVRTMRLINKYPDMAAMVFSGGMNLYRALRTAGILAKNRTTSKLQPQAQPQPQPQEVEQPPEASVKVSDGVARFRAMRREVKRVKRQTEELKGTIVDLLGKVRAFRALCAREGWSELDVKISQDMVDIIAVGDWIRSRVTSVKYNLIGG